MSIPIISGARRRRARQCCKSHTKQSGGNGINWKGKGIGFISNSFFSWISKLPGIKIKPITSMVIYISRVQNNYKHHSFICSVNKLLAIIAYFVTTKTNTTKTLSSTFIQRMPFDELDFYCVLFACLELQRPHALHQEDMLFIWALTLQTRNIKCKCGLYLFSFNVWCWYKMNIT